MNKEITSYMETYSPDVSLSASLSHSEEREDRVGRHHAKAVKGAKQQSLSPPFLSFEAPRRFNHS